MCVQVVGQAARQGSLPSALPHGAAGALSLGRAEQHTLQQAGSEQIYIEALHARPPVLPDPRSPLEVLLVAHAINHRSNHDAVEGSYGGTFSAPMPSTFVILADLYTAHFASDLRPVC